MRRITRNAILLILGVVVGLLALGALPGLIQTGDPYHLEAETTEATGESVDIDGLSERRFPFLFEAIEAADSGDQPARSTAYFTGAVGFKEAFTHTPFDEFDELESRNPDAIERTATSPVGDVIYVERSDTRYRIEIVRGQP
ncbi:MAG: hypothetical protein PPP58_05895 [Natronomonas sp.]